MNFRLNKETPLCFPLVPLHDPPVSIIKAAKLVLIQEHDYKFENFHNLVGAKH